MLAWWNMEIRQTGSDLAGLGRFVEGWRIGIGCTFESSEGVKRGRYPELSKSCEKSTLEAMLKSFIHKYYSPMSTKQWCYRRSPNKLWRAYL